MRPNSKRHILITYFEDKQKMHTPKQTLEEIKMVFENHNSFMIISHRAPDADAIGANLALRRALMKMGKTVISACVDPIPDSSMFLKDADKYVTDIEPYMSTCEVVISVDCGAQSLVSYIEKYPDFFSGKIPYINIDHHASNDGFGTINLVDADSCSTVFLIYHLFNDLILEIDREMASCLMHGLYFDTGSFMHPNTDSNVLMMAYELARRGADFKRSAKELFHNTPVNHLKIWGLAMERLKVNREHVAISHLGKEDFNKYGADKEALSGIMNYINSIPDVKFSMLLAEDGKGNVKGSTRTQRSDVDLSEWCSKYGGGGHKMAAGFTVPGQLKEEVVYQIDNNSDEPIRF